ncbi:unnamed protein product [Rhodiola kirilowii]
MTRSFSPLWKLIKTVQGHRCCQYSKLAVQELELKQQEVMKCKARTSARNSNWVPHARTGIYFPQGHERVMEDVPIGAATLKGHQTYWLRNVEGVDQAYPETPTDDYLL